MKRWIVAVLMLCLMLSQVAPVTVDAKSKTVNGLVKVVKKYTKDYPFSSADRVKSKKAVFGIMSSKLSKYSAYQKVETTFSAGTTEHMLFIGKAKTKANAKSCASSLRRFLTKEKSSKASGLTAEGRQLFSGAKIGSKGKWCWLIMVNSDSEANATVAKAVRKNAK